ncbi:MAG: hypothetical protein SWE60_02840 [Thermodesulfobacteriota bacterium]|nr:hypothetical protein [Thermodesulfobacteriota bacterium]
MEPRPKACHKTDQKNVYCPHYGQCLDQAAKAYWPSWDCSECPYKTTIQPLKVDQAARVLNLCGEVPPHLCRRVLRTTAEAA